jgi:hypothetical protein
MSELEAARRLVKSAPELWAACSDPDSLSRHLRVFGEIKITRLEPETTVAWEGESVSGTVVLEPSGWGTKVTLTAGVTGELVLESNAPVEPAVPEPAAPESAVPEPAAPAVPEPVAIAPKPAGGFFSRWRKSPVPPAPTPVPEAVSQSEPEPVFAPEPEPEPAPAVAQAAAPVDAPVVDALAALEAALDSLGQAHHRPYSRS